MDDNLSMITSGVEQTLHRVHLLINDETIRLAWNLQADLQGIEASTDVLIDLLRDVEMRLLESKPAGRWLSKLEEAAYEAEDVVDELSYQILRRKVRSRTSMEHIRFFKNVVFNYLLAHKVMNVNRELRMIYDEGKRDLRLTRTSGGLPLRFRPWLGFCLSFPGNFLIQKAELIQLWMAGGFLQSFDEGDELLKSLVSSSFLKGLEGDDNVVLFNPDSSSESIKTSHIRYLYATNPLDIPKDRANKLRSLILDGVPFPASWKLERLTILVFLNEGDMKRLPSSIARLKYLRYLDVSNTRIRALPKFITKLYNLQTLRFLKCQELKKLPRQFNNVINLKNIAFSFEHHMPFGLGHLTCLETLSFFVVGSDRGGSIEELKYLNGLRGHLDITRLEEVRDWRESEGANLQKKVKINGLSFEWSYGGRDRSSSDEKLLEGLQPHPHIQTMKIKYYMGDNWPSWMFRTRHPNNGDSFIMNNLVSLTLEHCWNCMQLPCLGDCPCLEFLTIQHMERVKFLYDESYSEIDNEGNSARILYPALKSLSLSWMDNLIEWSSTEMPLDNKKVVVFPLLETLTIHSCAKLTSFPVNDLSKLMKIEIRDCDELRILFHEQQSFPSLTSLSIEGCPKLTYLPNWLLSDARFNIFRVRRCEWLKFISDNLGLQRSLPSLEINCCRRLAFFSEDILCKLTQLNKLSIGAFSEQLDDFRYLNRIKELRQLKELEIWGSDFLGRKMYHLPYQLQHLTSLKSLKIMGFTTMEVLPEWLTDLQSLQGLSLNYCWHLEFQSTATIIRRLPNLEELYIFGCHTLERKKYHWKQFSRSTKIRIHFSRTDKFSCYEDISITKAEKPLFGQDRAKSEEAYNESWNLRTQDSLPRENQIESWN